VILVRARAITSWLPTYNTLANDACKRLLAVDPAIEQERQRLLRDEHALQEGHEQLLALLQPSSLGGNPGLLSSDAHDDLAVQERDEHSSVELCSENYSTPKRREV
jgi:hypothetical protein